MATLCSPALSAAGVVDAAVVCDEACVVVDVEPDAVALVVSEDVPRQDQVRGGRERHAVDCSEHGGIRV